MTTPLPSRTLTQRTPDELRAQLRNERAELRHATRTLLDETNLRLAAPASVHLDHVYLQLVLEYAAAVTEHVQLASFVDRAGDESSSSLPPTRDTDRPPPAARPSDGVPRLCPDCGGAGMMHPEGDTFGGTMKTCDMCFGQGEVMP